MVYAGSLQFLYFDDLHGEAKEKRCLTVSGDPYMFLLISSEVPEFIRNTVGKSERQVVIDHENHNFILNRDSYIDCTEPHGLHIDELQRQMQDKHKKVRGNVSQEVLNRVIDATDGSPLLSTRIQGFILDSIRPLVEHSA